MDRRRMLLGGGFPKEPSAYEILSTYTKDDIFTAPKNGWYQIEVFGASGNGGEPYYSRGRYEEDSGIFIYFTRSASGGGGGGYACSRVKMKKGDTAKLFPRGVGGTSSIAMIQSSMEKYENVEVTSGGNGDKASSSSNAMEVGAGGVAKGGNYENADGKPGSYQTDSGAFEAGDGTPVYVIGYGGAPGHPDGNYGGQGEGLDNATVIPATKGAAGFIRISAGKTN